MTVLREKIKAYWHNWFHIGHSEPAKRKSWAWLSDVTAYLLAYFSVSFQSVFSLSLNNNGLKFMPQPLNTSWITLPQSLSSSPSPKPSSAPLVDLILRPRIHSVYGNPWASLLTVNIPGLKTHKAIKPLAALSICFLNIVKITVTEPLKKGFQRANQGFVGCVWFMYWMLELYYRAFSRDVTVAILVFQNNETAAMLV